MSRTSTTLLSLLLLSGCGLSDLPIGDPLDVVPQPNPPGRDEPHVTPADPSDEPDEVDVETPPDPRVDFHGLSCSENGPATWNADDLCGPEVPGCDLVVITAVCDLFPGGEPRVCLARNAEGAWTTCLDALVTRLPEAEAERLRAAPELFWLAITEAYDYEQAPRLSIERDVSRCIDPDRLSVPDEVEAYPWGLYFRENGIEHETCAGGEFEGVWGGGPGLGSVRAPVIESCEASLTANGWNVQREDDGLWLVTRSFSARRVISGFVDDLRLP